MFWVLLGLLVAYIALLLGVAGLSRRPPRLPVWISPASLEVPTESIRIEHLHAWWCPHPQPVGVAILVHGYAMNRAELAPEAAVLWREGWSVLLVETRSHGRSRGQGATYGWTERADVTAACLEAARRAPDVPRLLMGSSQGASAAAFALGDDPSLADALILDSAYGRMDRAIRGFLNFLVTPRFAPLLAPGVPLTALFLGFAPWKKDVAEALKRMGPMPTLLFHGDRDPVATPEEAKRNLAALAGPTTVVWFPGMGHSEGRWERASEYHAALRQFVRGLTQSSRAVGPDPYTDEAEIAP